MFAMRLIPTAGACLFVLCARLLAAGDLVNLATEQSVRYLYVDQNGNELNGAAFNDPKNNFLTDGSVDDKSVATVPYRVQQEKTLNVRFEFPAAVTAQKLTLTWMWAHNPKQWFDTIQVFAGNDPAQLVPAATYTHQELGKNHHYDIDINLPAKPVRFILIRVVQNPSPDRYMFGIGEIRIFGDAREKARLQAASQKKAVFELQRQSPCNLFETGKDVVLSGTLTSPAAGQCRADFVLRNYFGDIVDQQDYVLAVSADGPAPVQIRFANLDRGYYELSTTMEIIADNQERYQVSRKASFGVADVMLQTAEEALERGARFGIQPNFGGPESADAFMRLGLNWVRPLLCYAPEVGGNPDNPDWSKMDGRLKMWVLDRPGLGLFEIKTIPSFAYDAERYGETKVRNWMLDTLPKKEPYQKFIYEQIKRVPANQKYFEIWNEPWDGHSVEQFATIAQWTLEAIKKARPDAVVGPNLGPGGYTARFMEIGGMNGMDMLTIHPYSDDFRSSPERTELRQRVRSYHQMFRDILKKDLPIYVTEIGWPTPPEGPMVNSENRQAHYMVRACLALYAEDIKAVMPYCMGQSEVNRAEKEHYFGFVKKNLEPKPVLLAYANMARLINGSEYLGDIWLGRDIAGMLFKKGQERILAIYTDNGKRPVFLRPYASRVKLVDIVGSEKTAEVVSNRLSLTATDDPIFVVGVGAELESQAKKQIDSIWSDIYKRITRKIGQLTPSITGDPAPWAGITGIALSDPNIPAADCSAELKAAWDKDHLYFRVDVRDNDPMNNNWQGTDIWRGDCLELFISAKPDAAVAGFVKPNDYQILISPTSASGQPVAIMGDTYHKGKPIEGIRTFFKKTADGWMGEVAIPFKSLGITPAKGMTLAMDAAIDDLDKNKSRTQITSNHRADNFSNAYAWSLLVLE